MLLDAGAQILGTNTLLFSVYPTTDILTPELSIEFDNISLVKAWLEIDTEAEAGVFFGADEVGLSRTLCTPLRLNSD